MTPRSRPRALAALTAAGTILFTLAAGGSASADDAAPLAAPDTGAPSLIVELPQPSPRGWYTAEVPITLAAADMEGPVTAIHWSVDGGPATVVSGASATATIATGGEHVFSAFAVDAAGNRSGTLTRDVNVDLAAPWVATFSQPQDAQFDLGEQVDLGYICDDDLSGVDSCTDEDRVDGRLDTATAGPKEVRVRAADVAGNEQTISYRYTVVDEATPPTVSASVSGAQGSNGWFAGDATVTLTVAEAEGGTILHYQVPGGEPVSVAGTAASFDVTSDGVFDIVYSAEDAEGNRSAEQTITVRRDSVAPVIDISAGAAAPIFAADEVPNGAVVAQGAEFALDYTCSDELSGVETCEGDIPTGTLLPTDDLGYHEILVTSSDAAGNESSAIFEYTVEVVGEPTDPETPAEPGTPAQPGGPAAPSGSGGAPSGAAAAPRPAAATVDGWLASTGGAAPWALTIAAATLVGAGALALVARRRLVD
ncbi:hypothetical protein [uncultured Microbacterium sp.]|uniref:hypothetical protein n=1 Tax=uncultured Microbacterium sp. TaxID=191216 RepID=UPI0028DD05F6|nr:hypothetical protein [uncultured Microbacterium sp.]